MAVNGGAWLLKIPASYIGQNLYLKAEAAGVTEGYAADPGTATVAALPAKGQAGIALSIAVTDTATADVTNLGGIPGNGQVSLAWTDPVDTDLDHIEITVTPSVAGSPFTAAKGTGSKTVTGLANGTAYTFTVKAVYTGGNMSAGASVGPITPIVPSVDLYVGTSITPEPGAYSLATAISWLGAHAADDG